MILKFLLVLILSVNINGQIDDTFCGPSVFTTVLPQLQLPLFPINFVFQLSMEVNSELSQSTYEIDQYYDGMNNRAVNIFTQKGKLFNIYTDDKKDEVIIVSGDACFVQKASTSSLSPIPSVMINGTEHIIPIFDLPMLQNPDTKVFYTGASTVRGISVLQWQFCYYSASSQITQKITHSWSDPTLWSTAIGTKSAPIEYKIENKMKNGTIWTDIYTITKFVPTIIQPYDFWSTPSGVYCPGRDIGRYIPQISKSYHYRAKVVTPLPSSDEFMGEVDEYEETNSDVFQMKRIDYNSKGTKITEIHQYLDNLGLRYKIDQSTGNCSIEKIEESTQMNIYDYINNTNYQYVGIKHVNHILTDVWIGQRMINNMTANLEWHFIAAGYVDTSELNQRDMPVLLIITLFRVITDTTTGQPTTVKFPIYYYFNEFVENDIDLRAFDISICMESYPKKNFLFKLPEDNTELIRQNRKSLRLGVALGIAQSVNVYQIRISNIHINFNQDTIVVLFTLFERSQFYTNLTLDYPEFSLEEASSILYKASADGKLGIILYVSNDNKDQTFLKAVPNSLNEYEKGGSTNIIQYCNGTVAVVTQSPTTASPNSDSKGFTMGQVAGIVVGVLVVGLVLGVIATLLIVIFKPNLLPFKRLDNNLSMGYKNPHFK